MRFRMEEPRAGETLGMWRSVLEIWIAWTVVALVAGGLLFTAAARITGRIDERAIHRIVLWSRIGLSITFLYGD